MELELILYLLNQSYDTGSPLTCQQVATNSSIDNLHNRLNLDPSKSVFHHSYKEYRKLVKLSSVVAKCCKSTEHTAVRSSQIQLRSQPDCLVMLWDI